MTSFLQQSKLISNSIELRPGFWQDTEEEEDRDDFAWEHADEDDEDDE